MIQVTCSHCKAVLDIPDQYAGQSGKCNKCGAALYVPVQATPPPINRSLVDDIAPPSTYVYPTVEPEEKKRKPLNPVLVGCGGCLLIPVGIMLFAAVLGAIQGPVSEPIERTRPSQPVTQAVSPTRSESPDLSDLDRRLENILKESVEEEGLQYKIHKVKIEGDWLVVVLDLQFKPESLAFLKKEASIWMSSARHSKIDGVYVADTGMNVRVSMWTVFSPDEIIMWGSLRHSAGSATWTDGSAVQMITNSGGAVISQDSKTVYVTASGSKYHSASCRHLSKSRKPIPLSHAKTQYEPCSVCNP